MNINNLPDECLLHVFNLINRCDTLLNCARVCERWKCLVLERCKNVNYLTDSLKVDGYPASRTILFKDDDQLERFELLKCLPKLKILDVKRKLDNDFILNVKVKGLLFKCDIYLDLENDTCHNPSLEMLAIKQLSGFFVNKIQGPRLKQLFLTSCSVPEFASCAKYFPNLERLHIYEQSRFLDDGAYIGPVLEKLEILEMGYRSRVDTWKYHAFSLADHCPALKSAFHYIQYFEEILVDSEIKNHFLEDLVIEFEEDQDWSILRRILSKYPNLKHLAIRREHEYDTGISDENIPELLELLPCIRLIDIRISRKVTKKSTEYIDRYCRRHNRSISLYYDYETKITEKWPHLSTEYSRIGLGFDFMKFCFLRDFDELPLLLDPDE
ncbi:uncharacterized protein LOC107361487 [Tetranychus urticae]|uniref:F-box domain-containing protein n=1 Tax=Tetranychus urticae TaxID=32264 RepID=T1K8B2_TETUR|nr:uncharacterized protein LOC107361487 [Tetranychus urticae]